MRSSSFQVIVIGGGHAGVEAAWAAANLLGEPGCVALVTLDPDRIGEMSCNPAIGGLAKGQIVRELDALGGLMALATDATSIHSKVLNTSKGPAVHGPRAQCDKHAYAETVRAMLASRPEIVVIAGGVESFILEPAGTGTRERRVAGVNIRTREGNERSLRAPGVVLTTGTFMRGLMHTGDVRTPGGRHGEAPATAISNTLRELGFELGRLKTGTPPRLKRSTIDWDALEAQWGDAPPIAFSDLTNASRVGIDTSECDPLAAPSLDRFPILPQVDCRQTRTDASSHALIRANLHRAPMFTGQIESAGPRYCPSIEDKVVRFADRDSHGVYLEPESLRTDWIYCNGIATSLPADLQDQLVRAMPGCANAEILRYGYAVEYDMVRPHQIHATGETKLVAGLFLAGQINGTSGYEEAAAQGVIAGINAALRARADGRTSHEGFVLGREEAYIGVLMDDLVTKTPVEPYRMFTSRAEHRLLLRADNAADRLTPRAIDACLLSRNSLGRARMLRFQRRERELRELRDLLASASIDGVPLSRLVKRTETTLHDFRDMLPGLAFMPDVWTTAYAESRYEGFITRQQAEVRRQRGSESRRIPEGTDYAAMPELRNEARQALARFRPDTFGQAARLEGITPADITLLSVLVRRGRGQSMPTASA
ncbi:MAG: tRNA uridine-5-carboxymethylaminomethyl(34) synthesis enzyme MnmG [Phycisphaerales bacterium]|jgi:tRNA uridine 5-carboxymethylaminomethyl modification enzyme|nr:tRNA uridine-5-carboxymethylaminomethyl(34) synthesis enzyme MnmG [Phycisphaerales bacterium]